MTEVVVLLSADIDIQRAYNWFEEQRAGRGDTFLKRIEIALSQLALYPESGPIYEDDVRRLIVHGTNYGIFYHVEARGVMVFGVADLRHDLDFLRRRLQ